MTLDKDKQRQKHLRFDFPNTVGISLGEWTCNINCRMCPMYNTPPEHARVMSQEVFDKICAIIGERKTTFEISAWGDTFQHPKADDFMFQARRDCPNAFINVATNGLLVGNKRAHKIVDSGIDYLQFSLDAGSPETYEWLTGNKNYEKICANLENLANVKAQKNAKHLTIAVHIIGIKELQHEFEGFKKRWEGVADFVWVRPYGNWAGMVDHNGVTALEKQELPDERYPCSWLWYATKIEPNGDISKCFVHITGERHPIGNIMEEDFDKIWKGYHMQRLRELHLTNRSHRMEHCQTCNVWSLFPNFWDHTDQETNQKGQKDWA